MSEEDMPLKFKIYDKICQDAWVVNLLHRSSTVEQEPVKFEAAGSNPADADLEPALYDVEGKKMEIPPCPACGSLMSCIIGHHAYSWYCPCSTLEGMVEPQKEAPEPG